MRRRVLTTGSTMVRAAAHRRGMTGVAAVLAAATLLHGQTREWTTSGFDAQRSGWVRSDSRLTRESVAQGQFQFLWKMRFDNAARQLHALTPPVLLDRLIGYRGFKSLAFVGGSDDRVFAVDTDLARPYWTAVLNYTAATGGRPPASADCPGGLLAMPSRRTPLAPPAEVAPGEGAGRGGVRNGSAVGEPGRGAAVLSQRPPQRAEGGPARGGRQGGAGREGRGGLAGRGAGFGGVEPLFALGSDGYLRALFVSNGAEIERAQPFIPPDGKPSSLIVVDGVVYTTTSGECGAVPNAVWAMDVSVPPEERRTVSWKTGGAPVAGASGVAFGADGTLFVALGKAPEGNPVSAHADAIVALDRVTLEPKDWFRAPGADFNTTPLVFRRGDAELVAATANDGRLYVLNGASLGGADRKTPLAVSERFTLPGGVAGLATFEENGTRWILATAAGTPSPAVKFGANGLAPNGRIVAFKVVDDAGTLTLVPSWQSRDLISPLPPVVINGMVFAVSSGEYRGAAPASAAGRAKLSRPAVLYVLDGATGKAMWSSGTRMTSFARAGLSAGGGQVYVVTYDNHVYAFGIPMEH